MAASDALASDRALRDSAAAQVGVDLGGTKIEVIALAPSGDELFRRRASTPPDYDAMLKAIAELVSAAKCEVGGEVTVGVGAPGSLSPRSGVWRNCNLAFCNDRDLPADLTAALGRPVRVENDGNCFVLSEATDGAGKGAWTVYGIVAGTGLGGGMTVGGALNRGHNIAAGEVGHVPLPWLQPEDYPLPPCYCGQVGCAEQYISGTGFENDYRKATGRELTGEGIMARAAEGETEAAAAVERLYERFARFLSVLVNILDPDVIVLGGGLSDVPSLCETVSVRVPRYTFARDISVRFIRAVHGDASGVRGAARLWDS
jgi:fructokinase